MFFFFFNDTATTEIYTLSLHDALPISVRVVRAGRPGVGQGAHGLGDHPRSEEHTSELQSQSNLVCRLLLEKKKINTGKECATTTERSISRYRVYAGSHCQCHLSITHGN